MTTNEEQTRREEARIALEMTWPELARKVISSGEPQSLVAQRHSFLLQARLGLETAQAAEASRQAAAAASKTAFWTMWLAIATFLMAASTVLLALAGTD